MEEGAAVAPASTLMPVSISTSPKNWEHTRAVKRKVKIADLLLILDLRITRVWSLEALQLSLLLLQSTVDIPDKPNVCQTHIHTDFHEKVRVLFQINLTFDDIRVDTSARLMRTQRSINHFKGFQGISKLFLLFGVHKCWKSYLNGLNFKVLNCCNSSCQMSLWFEVKKGMQPQCIFYLSL